MQSPWNGARHSNEPATLLNKRTNQKIPIFSLLVNFCVEILRQIENRAIAYALSWDRVRQQLAILQMGIGYNEFIAMFYIQA